MYAPIGSSKVCFLVKVLGSENVDLIIRSFQESNKRQCFKFCRVNSELIIQRNLTENFEDKLSLVDVIPDLNSRPE